VFVSDKAQQIVVVAGLTMERHAATVFVNAFTGAGGLVAEDGLSLCNSAHLNSDGGNSQGNSGTSSLTFANAKTTRTAMRKFKGYRDSSTTLYVNPDELMVPVDLEEDAFALIESTLKPGSLNNDLNLFAGRYTVYVWPFLSDTNDWFMMDSARRKLALRWYMRRPLTILSDASFIQGVRKIGASMRYSFGSTDWRWIYGHSVT
jgi:hypothetical protein